MDISTIWKRFKNDYKNSFFIHHPFEVSLIELDLDNWLKELEKKFSGETFQPSRMYVCDVPKGKGLIRPGSFLKIEDALYYIWLVSNCYDKIYNHIKWAQGNVDFAYMLKEEGISNFKWLDNQFIGWEKFREESIKKINEGFPYVIITDVTGFYENIHLRTLYTDLKEANVEDSIAKKIKACHDRWCQIEGKGIPQSISASHILAKLYFNPIDLALRNKKYVHLRYVDDIRIFCRTKVEAKEALIYLTQLMRERGLNLQSAKTKIHRSDEAYDIIVGVQVVIQNIAKKIREESEKETIEFLVPTPYGDDNFFDEQEDIDNIDPESASIDIVKETFRAYFIDSNNSKFDKTLFRFLLKRLGAAKEKFAVNYCLDQLENHPEETDAFLKYFSAVEEYDYVINSIIDFLQSEYSIYHYQTYQILDWLSNNYSSAPESLVSIVREIISNNNYPFYIKSVARKFIGNIGNIADLNDLLRQYEATSDLLEQSEIICALHKMEKTKRNNFYNRMQRDGKLNELAVKYVKSRDSNLPSPALAKIQ